MNTIKKFLATDQQSWSLLIVRLALGFVLLPHGMQNLMQDERLIMTTIVGRLLKTF